MHEGLRLYEKLSVEDQGKLILGKLENYREAIPTVWENVRTLGSRIWDGLRRVWGWLRKLVESASKKVVVIGRNMSRLIYDYTLGAYEVVANTLTGFGKSVALFVQPHLPCSDPAAAIISHDRDFDFRITVNVSAAPELMAVMCEKLNFGARIFRFTCVVLGVFISILLSVIKSGWAGYPGMVFALVKFCGQWHRLGPLCEAYRALFVNC